MSRPRELDLSPAPRPATAAQRIRWQSLYELSLLMRNGEQVLLTLVIPILLVVGLAKTGVVDLGAAANGYPRIQTVVPGVLALAVLSSAFTAQAISVGFDRRYGVLMFIGTTPLGRTGLVLGKTIAIGLIVIGQVIIIGGVGALLGWRPQGAIVLAFALIALALAAFSGLALLMAGTLRAEATLAGANLVFVLLLLGGGTIIAPSEYPAGAEQVVQFLPTAALAEGLRDVLRDGQAPPLQIWLVLAVWALASLSAAGRFFRWD